MIIYKTSREIEKMRIAGERLATILQAMSPLISPGTSLKALDDFLALQLRQSGLMPECLGYHGYPAVSCISVNDVIVHGIPYKEGILKSGDYVKIDIVASYKGYCADMTRTYSVGPATEAVKAIDKVVKAALEAGLAMIKPGIKLNEVSKAIQQVVENAGYSVVRDFVGHGIGRQMHEDPSVLNYFDPHQDDILREGMTLAIEPIIAERKSKVIFEADGWTARTGDGCLAAHIEDTILVTPNGYENLTRIGAMEVL